MVIYGVFFLNNWSYFWLFMSATWYITSEFHKSLNQFRKLRTRSSLKLSEKNVLTLVDLQTSFSELLLRSSILFMQLLIKLNFDPIEMPEMK